MNPKKQQITQEWHRSADALRGSCSGARSRVAGRRKSEDGKTRVSATLQYNTANIGDGQVVHLLLRVSSSIFESNVAANINGFHVCAICIEIVALKTQYLQCFLHSTVQNIGM